MTDNSNYISYLLLAFFAIMLTFSFVTKKLYHNYEVQQAALEQYSESDSE